jgi:hypothetical protein
VASCGVKKLASTLNTSESNAPDDQRPGVDRAGSDSWGSQFTFASDLAELALLSQDAQAPTDEGPSHRLMLPRVCEVATSQDSQIAVCCWREFAACGPCRPRPCLDIVHPKAEPRRKAAEDDDGDGPTSGVVH